MLPEFATLTVQFLPEPEALLFLASGIAGLAILGNDKRSHPRTDVQIAARCASGTERGSGTLADISLSGALLEKTSVRPRLGAPVEIRFRLPNADEPFALVGTVVRHSASGFAIQFATSEEVVRQLLERGMLLPEA